MSSKGKASMDIDMMDVLFEHNTIISEERARELLNLRGTGTERVVLRRNLFMRSDSNGWSELVSVTGNPPSDNLSSSDENWFSYLNNRTDVRVNGMLLSERQNTTGYDLKSQAGFVPGVKAPSRPNAAWADLRKWYDIAFLDQFTPAKEFGGCAQEATPGAFDCSGKRLGLALKPFKDVAENEGYGWEGPPLIPKALSPA